MDGYNRGGHVKFYLTAHVIFVTKYRKQLFNGNVADDVKQFLFDAANLIDVQIIAMETDKDHVHILVSYKPSMSISNIVRCLKQQSTYHMWQRHRNLLMQNY